jgi:biotin-(acetyl-CoA carboxylase) ligase
MSYADTLKHTVKQYHSGSISRDELRTWLKHSLTLQMSIRIEQTTRRMLKSKIQTIRSLF